MSRAGAGSGSGRPRAPLDLPGVTVASRLPAGDASPSGGDRAAGRRRDPAAHAQRVGPEVDGDVRSVLAYVVRSTNARPQTEGEMRAKLRQREVDEELADEALAHARRLGAVDDARLAHALVAERGVRRGFGRARLREELTRRQVPEHLVEDALAPLDERDDLAAATELARERLRQLPGGLPRGTVARRLAAYVARRGHPPGLAERVGIEVSGLGERWD